MYVDPSLSISRKPSQIVSMDGLSTMDKPDTTATQQVPPMEPNFFRDIIGVALDMVEGTLGYYRNETYWGVAFKDE